MRLVLCQVLRALPVGPQYSYKLPPEKLPCWHALSAARVSSGCPSCRIGQPCQEELLQQEGDQDMQAMSGLCKATVSALQHVLGLSDKLLQQD